MFLCNVLGVISYCDLSDIPAVVKNASAAVLSHASEQFYLLKTVVFTARPVI